MARLATVNQGRPHVVPITFAIHEETVFTMVDHKPKTTQRLRRIDNIRANPSVSVLVDHYEDDWSGLWWVRIDGTAVIATSGETWQTARKHLALKYSQYGDRPPEGPAIAIRVDAVTDWST